MTSNQDFQWHIVQRWQEIRGEARANLLRILAIGVFYAIEWVNATGVDFGPFHLAPVVNQSFHRLMTALTLAWCLEAMAILLCLRRQIVPSALKFIATFSDLTLLTFILAIADGARSPLVILYFLVIVLSAQRFSLRLIQFATLGSLLSYGVLIGYARWWQLPRPPHYAELIFLAGLAIAGIMMGQLVRRVRELADEYATRLENSQPKDIGQKGFL